MESFIPLIVAAVLSGLIGVEREVEGKAAGFRTHLLIGLGAALLSLLSVEAAAGGVASFADPGRIAAQIVSGIGFVGAGAIIQSRASVKGLTTAATLWVAAAIGMACAFDQYGAAVLVTAVSLFSLRTLGQLDQFFHTRARWHYVEVVSVRGREALETLLAEHLAGPPFRGWQVDRAFVSEGRYGCVIRVRARREEVARMVGRLSDAPEGGVAEARLI